MPLEVLRGHPGASVGVTLGGVSLMSSILNHSENVNPASKPVQSRTVEGSPFTCKETQLRWPAESDTDSHTVSLKKCGCRSSWCPICWKGLKRAAVERLRSFDPEFTRELMLSVSRSPYVDGREAYSEINSKRGIGRLLKQLERAEGVKIVDWVCFLEWHEDGFPHWHLFIETENKGRAGMIGHGVIKRWWPFGKVIWEHYIESEEHWKNLVGYFDKHGYFEKGKSYQGKLPVWALDSNGKIRRWFGKPSDGLGRKRRPRIRLKTTSPVDQGFSTDAEKCEKCNCKSVCETESDGNGCIDYGAQDNGFNNRFKVGEALRKIKVCESYRVRIAKCGALMLDNNRR